MATKNNKQIIEENLNLLNEAKLDLILDEINQLTTQAELNEIILSNIDSTAFDDDLTPALESIDMSDTISILNQIKAELTKK